MLAAVKWPETFSRLSKEAVLCLKDLKVLRLGNGIILITFADLISFAGTSRVFI